MKSNENRENGLEKQENVFDNHICINSLNLNINIYYSSQEFFKESILMLRG